MQELIFIQYAGGVLLGIASLIGGLKLIDWLISQKYETKANCTTRISVEASNLKDMINQNRTAVTEKIELQYKDIVNKIQEQTKIFQGLATSVAEISAENKIILRQFENINKK